MPKKIKTSATERGPQQQIQQEHTEQLERSSINSALQRSHHDGGLPRGGGLQRGSGLQRGNGLEHNSMQVAPHTSSATPIIARKPLIQPTQLLRMNTPNNPLKLSHRGLISRSMTPHGKQQPHSSTTPARGNATKRVQRNRIDRHRKTELSDDAMQVDDEMNEQRHEMHNGSIDRQSDIIQRLPRMGMEFQVLSRNSLKEKDTKTGEWDKPDESGSIIQHTRGEFKITADGREVEYVLDPQFVMRDGAEGLVDAAKDAAEFHKLFRKGDQNAFTNCQNITDVSFVNKFLHFTSNGRELRYRKNTATAGPQFSLGIDIARFVTFVEEYSKAVGLMTDEEKERWSMFALAPEQQERSRWGKAANNAEQVDLYKPIQLGTITSAIAEVKQNHNQSATPIVLSFLTLLSEYVRFAYRGFVNAKMNLPIMGRTSLGAVWDQMDIGERNFIQNILESDEDNYKDIRKKLVGDQALDQYKIANDGGAGPLGLQQWWTALKTNGQDLLSWRNRTDQDNQNDVIDGKVVPYDGIGDLDTENPLWDSLKDSYGIEHPMDIGMDDVKGLIIEVRQLKRASPDEWGTMAEKVGKIAMWANQLVINNDGGIDDDGDDDDSSVASSLNSDSGDNDDD